MRAITNSLAESRAPMNELPPSPDRAVAPILSAYREKILYVLASIAAVVVAPFSLLNFAKGYFLVGVVTMAVVLMFIANAIAIYRRKALPVPLWIAFSAVLGTLVVAIEQRGLLGIFWTFPAILLIHFVLERKPANVLNFTLVALVAWVCFRSPEIQGDVALRILIGQLLTITFTNIFSYVVEAEQRKEAEQRRRLGLLVRATQAGFYQWDREGDTGTYSGRLKEMLGYAPDADTSSWPPFAALIHPDDRERRVSLFRAGARDRSVKGGEQRLGKGGDFRLKHANGEYIWVQSQGLFIHDDAGRVTRYISSLVDVTARYRQQEELRSSNNQIQVQAQQLRDQNAALRDAMRVREEVERIARHDLKTPLNSIVAVPRMLRERRKPDAAEEALLGMVESAAYRVLDMVNLSVDLYRMEQGDYSFSPRAVDLAGLVSTVSREVAAHAVSKGVMVEHVEGEAYAWGSELLCYSILANLLKNAVEASPDGARVRVRFTRDGDAVELQIVNEGVVPAGVRERFFEKYATSGKAGGFGLGTYSARLMARVQQGELSMHTSAGEGTRLTLRLPALPAGVQPASAPADEETVAGVAAPLPALRVLIVDDDEFNVAFVKSGLPTPPLTVATAINGRAAVDAARAHAPDVVFMDLEMPVMNGFEALGWIRALEAETGRRAARVIAFSSYDDEAIRRRCVEAGFDGYLSKPAPRERILDILRAAAAGQSPAPEAAPAGAAPAGPNDAVAVDPELRAALPRFLETRRALLGELRTALGEGDRDAARRHAHKLAGSLALYGFAWAAAESRALQHAADDGDLGALTRRADALLRHLETVTFTEGKGNERSPQAAAG
jgi:PAS domain S-box-containing protein